MRLPLILALLTLTSCSSISGMFGSSEPSSVAESLQKSEIEQAKQGAAASPDKTIPTTVPITSPTDGGKNVAQDIQVIWKVPEQPVDGFVIHYGLKKDALDKEVKLSIDQVEKFNHQQYGEVYRYNLNDVPQDEIIYVSISAYSDTIVSEPSEVFEVYPAESGS